MFQKSRSPIIKVILLLAALAFVGFSIVPIFQGIQESQQVTGTPTSAAATPETQKSELQSQEKGYGAVLQREPENQAALKGLLETRLQMVQLKMAEVKGVIEPLEKLVKLNPDNTEYAVLLAQAHQQVGDREAAAQTYRSVLATNPGDMNALQGLVGLQVQEQRPEAAVGLLQDTLQAAPQANQLKPGSIDVSSVQLLLGQVYAEQKRFDKAIALYDQVSKSNQQDFRPALGKALLLQQQGKTEAAKPLFQSATALAPAQYKDQIKQLESGAPTPASPSPPSPAAQPAPATAPQPTPGN